MAAGLDHARRPERESGPAGVRPDLPREVEPHEALLEEVWRTAGHVTWLGDVVGQLERNQVVHGITRTVQFRDGSRTVEARAAVNVWVKLYQEERDRLVRVARAAIVPASRSARCGSPRGRRSSWPR